MLGNHGNAVNSELSLNFSIGCAVLNRPVKLLSCLMFAKLVTNLYHLPQIIASLREESRLGIASENANYQHNLQISLCVVMICTTPYQVRIKDGTDRIDADRSVMNNRGSRASDSNVRPWKSMSVVVFRMPSAPNSCAILKIRSRLRSGSL